VVQFSCRRIGFTCLAAVAMDRARHVARFNYLGRSAGSLETLAADVFWR
jgi:hypothetical protein